MTNLMDSILEMGRSPITWAIWMFVASCLVSFLFLGFIERIARGILFGIIVILIFYGVYVVSTTQIFDQTSIYVIGASIVVMFIFMGFLANILKWIIFFSLIGVSAYGSYTIIDTCPQKEKVNEIMRESLDKSYNQLKNNKKLEETTSNWKKFVF